MPVTRIRLALALGSAIGVVCFAAKQNGKRLDRVSSRLTLPDSRTLRLRSALLCGSDQAFRCSLY